MKTTDLIGVKLDFYVAKAQGLNPYIEVAQRGEESFCYLPVDHSVARWYPMLYSPSTNWAQGGPILENLIMSGFGLTPARMSKNILCSSLDSESLSFNKGQAEIDQYGGTVLSATMRAFIISKFGDEVPDEV